MRETETQRLVELDELLNEPNIDYWSDEGVTIAQQMIDRLTDSEWDILRDMFPKKPAAWKCRLCNSLSHTKKTHSRTVLADLLFDRDENVALAAADSLRFQLPVPHEHQDRLLGRASELLAKARPVYVPVLELLVEGLSKPKS